MLLNFTPQKSFTPQKLIVSKRSKVNNKNSKNLKKKTNRTLSPKDYIKKSLSKQMFKVFIKRSAIHSLIDKLIFLFNNKKSPVFNRVRVRATHSVLAQSFFFSNLHKDVRSTHYLANEICKLYIEAKKNVIKKKKNY